MLLAVDDIRFGMVVRTARIRRAWRQRDLARVVGMSDGSISRVERGHLDSVSFGRLRRIAAALEIRVEVVARSRSANVDRLASAMHAGLAEAVITWLSAVGGWVVRPEVSFSRYGERGIIDLFAWHPGRRALIVIELKTLIVDVGELLGTLDRKARNALNVARDMGWDPIIASSLLIVAEGPTNRRRIDAHAATFQASLPDRVVALRRWLKDPVGAFRGLMFFSVRHEGQVIQRFDHRQRVTLGSRRSGARSPSVDAHGSDAGSADQGPPRVLRGGGHRRSAR